MRLLSIRLIRLLPAVLASLFVLTCCAPQQPVSRPTNRRDLTAQLPNAMLDQLTVEDLRVTADLMARDLVIQPFLYNRGPTAIVAIKPIENKTSLTIDPDILQKTMRVKLMEKSGGRLLFRDEFSHQYTINERLKQSGKVQVSSTSTRRRTSNSFRLGQPIQVTEQVQTDTVQTDHGEAVKRVADVDYFLTGLVYSSTEVARQGSNQGMRYFQFQLRLTDARSNIIMWEKEYAVKREAHFR
jgi:PBP1b-binding outer membrane lipoprotein LpoB